MSINLPANCINDVGYLPDLISSSNQTSTVNWSAAVSPFLVWLKCSLFIYKCLQGLKKIVTPEASTLPSCRSLVPNDVYSNATGLYYNGRQLFENWILGDQVSIMYGCVNIEKHYITFVTLIHTSLLSYSQEYARLFLENKKYLSPWLPIILVSAYLRALGQCMMINNVFR